MIHGIVKFYSTEFEPHRATINTLLAKRGEIQQRLQTAQNEDAKREILINEFRPVQTEIKALAAAVCLK